MRLSELVDELRNNILFDRSDSIGGDPDELWSTETLVRYINESQRRFAKRSFIIRDSTTPEVVNVELEEGVREYTLHPSILGVVTAKIEDATRDLVRVGHSVLDLYTPSTETFNAATLDSINPGAPQAYTTDETLGEDDNGTIAAVTFRVYPEPDADTAGTIIKLRVVRMPIDDLVPGNMSAIPEIPADHHMEMLDWAAYLALRIGDHEANDRKRAAEFAQSFEQHVRDAKTLVLRKMRTPQPWGFGRLGFSWGS